jgi:hypothetical protein
MMGGALGNATLRKICWPVCFIRMQAMQLYVYYKFDPVLSDDTMARAQTLQTQLLGEFLGVTVALLKRPAIDAEGLTTWMEAYQLRAADEDRFKARLTELALSFELPMPRHTEVFVNVNPQAPD